MLFLLTDGFVAVTVTTFVCKLVFVLWQLRPKKSQTISETRSKWSRFGAVCETRGLASLWEYGLPLHEPNPCLFDVFVVRDVVLCRYVKFKNMIGNDADSKIRKAEFIKEN